MFFQPLCGQEVNKKVIAIGKRFEKLPLEKRKEYMKHKTRAFKASKEKKIFTAMVEIDEASRIFSEDTDLIWLDGICRAEIHDVDGAIAYYKDVLKLYPAHVATLMNLVEINFFAKRYGETVKWIERMNTLLDNRANKQRMPLLEFKYLISLTKLAKKDPAKYQKRVEKVRAEYTYKDDNPFYYYAQALKELDKGDKGEGLVWIMKAYFIFRKPAIIEIWNKALVDSGYIGAYEIMFRKGKSKKKKGRR